MRGGASTGVAVAVGGTTGGATTGGAGVVCSPAGCAKRSVCNAYAVVSCLGFMGACTTFVSNFAVSVWARVRGDFSGSVVDFAVSTLCLSASSFVSAIYRSKIDS